MTGPERHVSDLWRRARTTVAVVATAASTGMTALVAVTLVQDRTAALTPLYGALLLVTVAGVVVAIVNQFTLQRSSALERYLETNLAELGSRETPLRKKIDDTDARLSIVIDQLRAEPEEVEGAFETSPNNGT